MYRLPAPHNIAEYASSRERRRRTLRSRLRFDDADVIPYSSRGRRSADERGRAVIFDNAAWPPIRHYCCVFGHHQARRLRCASRPLRHVICAAIEREAVRRKYRASSDLASAHFCASACGRRKRGKIFRLVPVDKIAYVDSISARRSTR